MNDKYLGMTVNERLYVSGLLPKFDEAVKAKDVERVREILKAVDIQGQNATDVLKAVGLL